MKKNSISDTLTNYTSTYYAYTENNSLNSDIDKILSTSSNKKYKQLSALNNKYHSSLAHAHINYYLKSHKKKAKKRLASISCLLIILIYFIFTLYLTYNNYERFNNFDVSTNTLQKAIEYYDQKDYEAALLRFQKLYDNNWINATIVHYLSSIYKTQKKYDDAALLIINYLSDQYGLMNVSDSNALYTDLLDLYINTSLSSSLTTDVNNALTTIRDYSSTYIQLFEDIKEGNYNDAAQLCQTLQHVGADGFYFISCYSTVLINQGKIDDAYTLIMDSVRDDSSPHLRVISTNQRAALVNYLKKYVTDSKLDDCNSFLANELKKLNIIDDSNWSEPYISYKDAQFQFEMNASINNLNFISNIDTITVDEQPILVNAKECYSITVTHYDANTEKTEYFLLDMNNNPYIYMNDMYIALPIDEPSDPGERQGILQNSYTQYTNPNIALYLQSNEYNQVLACNIQNNSTGEFIFSGPPTSVSDYGAFMYITLPHTTLTIFLADNNAIILPTQDSNNEYSYLEGRYLLSQQM